MKYIYKIPQKASFGVLKGMFSERKRYVYGIKSDAFYVKNLPFTGFSVLKSMRKI